MHMCAVFVYVNTEAVHMYAHTVGCVCAYVSVCVHVCMKGSTVFGQKG